jgi:hypothetical protein
VLDALAEEALKMPAVNGHLPFATVAFLSLALSACTGVSNKINAASTGSGGSSGSGTAFSVGGDVTGLLSGASVVLQDNGAASTTVSSNTAFTFSTAVNSGSAYAVMVQTQPADETCAITNGSGTVAAANISSIAVVCSQSTYNIVVAVSGLTGTGLVLQNKGALRPAMFRGVAGKPAPGSIFLEIYGCLEGMASTRPAPPRT